MLHQKRILPFFLTNEMLNIFIFNNFSKKSNTLRENDKNPFPFEGKRQSLLEHKAMNEERQHHIFVEPWSDSIHIALWKNDGF